MARRHREIKWELVVCGLFGHDLIGTDAAELREQDQLVARERDGVRWYRCLRCDAWVWREPPDSAAVSHPPDRDEIVIPDRGKALRDKIVLRLIAVDRLFHFLVLTVLGIAVLVLAGNEKAVRGDLERVLTALQGGVVQTRGHVGVLGELDKLFSLHSHTLRLVGVALLAYALVEGVEAVGLWLVKRWAEYLTFIATSLFLPLEVYEIATRPTPLKVIAFLVNLVIVVYLIWNKRLFGVRGGGAVDERQRAADMDWEAIERATPPVPVGA